MLVKISREQLKRAINKKLAPFLLAKGWNGKNFNYTKVVGNEFVHIITIDPQKYSGEKHLKGVCFNLGIIIRSVHFGFRPKNLNDLKVSNTEIRSILGPNGYMGLNGNKNYWNFDKMDTCTYQNANEVVEDFIKHFEKAENTFFNNFLNFPNPFESLTPNDLEFNSEDLFSKYGFYFKGLYIRNLDYTSRILKVAGLSERAELLDKLILEHPNYEMYSSAMGLKLG